MKKLFIVFFLFSVAKIYSQELHSIRVYPADFAGVISEMGGSFLDSLHKYVEANKIPVFKDSSFKKNTSLSDLDKMFDTLCCEIETWKTGEIKRCWRTEHDNRHFHYGKMKVTPRFISFDYPYYKIIIQDSKDTSEIHDKVSIYIPLENLTNISIFRKLLPYTKLAFGEKLLQYCNDLYLSYCRKLYTIAHDSLIPSYRNLYDELIDTFPASTLDSVLLDCDSASKMYLHKDRINSFKLLFSFNDLRIQKEGLGICTNLCIGGIDFNNANIFSLKYDDLKQFESNFELLDNVLDYCIKRRITRNAHFEYPDGEL